MSNPALPVGLPAGTDAGAALTKEVVPSFYNGGVGASARWTVPGGECWLVQSLLVKYSTAGAVAGRYVKVFMQDADAILVYAAGVNASFPASSAGYVTAALGADTGGVGAPVAGGGPGAVQLPLPYLVMLPDWQVDIFVDQANAGDTLTGGGTAAQDPQAVVTYWPLGSSAGGVGLLDLIPGYTPDELAGLAA